MQDDLYPYSVNKLIVGFDLNNIRGQESQIITCKRWNLKTMVIYIYGRMETISMFTNVHHGHLLNGKNDDFDLILTNGQINDLKTPSLFIGLQILCKLGRI